MIKDKIRLDKGDIDKREVGF